MKDFDLIYVSTDFGRTMALVVLGETRPLAGPFPASEAGPKIVDVLANDARFACVDRQDAERRYTFKHFHNMFRKCNDAGQDYPYDARTK